MGRLPFYHVALSITSILLSLIFEAISYPVILKEYELFWQYSDLTETWNLDGLTEVPISIKDQAVELDTITELELVDLLSFLQTALRQYHENPKKDPPAVTNVVIRRPTEKDPTKVHDMHKTFDSYGLENRYSVFKTYYFLFLFDKDPLSAEEQDTFVVQDYYKFYPDGTVGRADEKESLDFTAENNSSLNEVIGPADEKKVISEAKEGLKKQKRAR